MRYDVLTAVGMTMFSSITFMLMVYLILESVLHDSVTVQKTELNHVINHCSHYESHFHTPPASSNRLH